MLNVGDSSTRSSEREVLRVSVNHFGDYWGMALEYKLEKNIILVSNDGL